MRGLAMLLCGVVLALPCAAADESVPSSERAAETLKARLGDKASDEQRVDNCRVPAERRGAIWRPDCAAQDASRASDPSGHPPSPVRDLPALPTPAR